VSPKKREEIYEAFRKQSEDLRLLTYKVLVDNFNKKYSSLDEAQKDLLREFINNVSNTSTFPTFITEQRDKAIARLVKESNEIKDGVTRIKLLEMIKLIKSPKFLKENQEKQVSVLMLTHQLLKEIQNVKGTRTTKK
jgi:predicted transposase YdaD